jgi:hypothetical protein
MQGGPSPGSAASARETLEKVADRLSEWFRPQRAVGGSVPLVSASDALPDVELSLERDRRLFSRTMQLLVVARNAGDGPPEDAALALRARRILRRDQLDWRGVSPPDGDALTERFVQAGVVDGVRTMTNVRELELSWSASERWWRLRLLTLAGALIGTSPGAAVAVPLEPEDVEGLLMVLRAFRAGSTR